MSPTAAVPKASAPSPAAPAHDAPAPERAPAGLATELRDSLVLLGLSLGVTVGLTVAGQAALSALA